MQESTVTNCPPELSNRPFGLKVERTMSVSPELLFQAWTTRFDEWFAAPGCALITGIVNTAFYFEVVFKPEGQTEAQRHPHYGRFLRVEPHLLVEITWVTGAGGTKGAETVVTVEFTPQDTGTHLKLRHAGFVDEASRDQHQQAWPMVLDQLEKQTLGWK